MTVGPFWSLVPFLLGVFSGQPAVVGESVTRIISQDEMILRVPVQPRPLMPQIEWIERKGPRCVHIAEIQRALLQGSEQVDFILANRSRIRAHLDEDCPALDFYGGFYLQLEDDRLCAGRDAIRSRMGGSCTIERFSELVPKINR